MQKLKHFLGSEFEKETRLGAGTKKQTGCFILFYFKKGPTLSKFIFNKK